MERGVNDCKFCFYILFRTRGVPLFCVWRINIERLIRFYVLVCACLRYSMLESLVRNPFAMSTILKEENFLIDSKLMVFLLSRTFQMIFSFSLIFNFVSDQTSDKICDKFICLFLNIV